MSFSVPEGGSDPAAQIVIAANAGGGALDVPTTSTSYVNGSDWLTVTVSGASPPFRLSVQPTVHGLSAGTYTANVTVLSSRASNHSAGFSVTLTVSTPTVPQLHLSTSSLSFTGLPGGSDPTAQSVTVSNSGAGTLAVPIAPVTYGSGNGWLTASITGASAPFTLSVQPTISGLAAGRYEATVSVESTGALGSPARVSVTLTLTSSVSLWDVMAWDVNDWN